jgi:hypothetical protein
LIVAAQYMGEGAVERTHSSGCHMMSQGLHPMAKPNTFIRGCATCSLAVSLALSTASSGQIPPADDGVITRTTARGDTLHLMRANSLGSVSGRGNRLDLEAQKAVPTGGSPRYQLFATYVGRSPLSIEKERSLVVVIDGDSTHLNAWQGYERLGDGKIQETAVYAVDPALLQRLANAQAVTVRLRGQKANVDGSFTAENLRRFREFAAAYVPE